MKKLEGRTIKSIRTNADHTVLAFDTDDGVIAYGAEGDCCSESWFHHFSGVQELLGANVLQVESAPSWEPSARSDVTAEDIAEDSRHDSDNKDYWFDIFTVNAQTRIEMRNSSNGYYGGDVIEIDADDLERVNANVKVPVTEDW